MSVKRVNPVGDERTQCFELTLDLRLSDVFVPQAVNVARKRAKQDNGNVPVPNPNGVDEGSLSARGL